MGKIDDLKLRLDGSRMAINSSHAFIVKEQENVAEIKKQIADLEAAESKPKEWNMYLDHSGRLTAFPISFIWGNRVHEDHSKNTPITVIKKEPLVITKAMAHKASVAYYGEFVPMLHEPAALVLTLKAIGIDAIAADE